MAHSPVSVWCIHSVIMLARLSFDGFLRRSARPVAVPTKSKFDGTVWSGLSIARFFPAQHDRRSYSTNTVPDSGSSGSVNLSGVHVTLLCFQELALVLVHTSSLF